mgnify:CR=1 FL=1
MTFNDKCYQLLSQIPQGRVSTYKEIASALNTKAYQAVGNAMAKNPNLILVPMLAFNNKGYRLGYGKGFYDRFLSDCKAEVLKIGLSFFEPEEKLPADSHDIPLTHCITGAEIYKF